MVPTGRPRGAWFGNGPPSGGPFHDMKPLLLLTCLSLAALLAGCAIAPPEPTAAAVPDAGGWHAVGLPGKAATLYTPTVKDGRNAIAADAQRSASMWRHKLNVQPDQLGQAQFSWWVPALPAQANVAVAEREDAAVRVLFGFAGDVSALPARTRMMFELAEALTGEQPPYATLMYVWDTQAPVGSVIVNPRTDRVRKIVVDSGSSELGKWRDHQRDLRADYRLAFGTDPGPLVSVAMMTDSDNTANHSLSWYGPILVHGGKCCCHAQTQCKP